MTVITFHYRGRTEEGEVFFDSRKGEPFQLKTGAHLVMPLLEEGLIGMKPGESKSICVGKAYGEYDPAAVQKRILKEAIEDGERLEEGMEVMWTSPRNPHKPIPARIVRADDRSFDIDFNHPLAGKSIVYDVDVISVS